jgi:predicted amidophosphoribosyltransferase
LCAGQKLAWDRVTRLGAYDAPLDAWIKAMKFGRQWDWAAWLGARLSEAMGSPREVERTLVCAVPMPGRRRWRRGYNQAALMADAVAKARGVTRLGVLRRTRYTPPQTRVVPSQRSANIARSFAARPIDLRGWEVWLIDDVKTSGSTLSACSRRLKRAGAVSVHVGVAAVADPKGRGLGVK